MKVALIANPYCGRRAWETVYPPLARRLRQFPGINEVMLWTAPYDVFLYKSALANDPKGLAAAAEADYVIVIYNPRSRRRQDNLDRACDIIRRHRPVGHESLGVMHQRRVKRSEERLERHWVRRTDPPGPDREEICLGGIGHEGVLPPRVSGVSLGEG